MKVIVQVWASLMLIETSSQDKIINGSFLAYAFSFPTNAARYNALSYHSINLPSESNINYQQNVSSVPVVVPSSTITQNKYGVASIRLMLFVATDKSDVNNDTDSLSDIFHVMVGTKFGDLISLHIEHRNETWGVSHSLPVEWLKSQNQIGKVKSPLPNYCMATTTEGKSNTMLLVGSADRYVNIWQRDSQPNQTNLDGGWNITQRLGPHTGWVKALSILPPIVNSETPTKHKQFVAGIEHHRLLSIGCNRIEYWAYSNVNQKKIMECRWTHIGTTSIDSSPTVVASATTSSTIGAACTLSSDLLCLQVCQIVTSFEVHVSVIAVGGVDGRIHFYHDSRTMTDRIEHLVTITAHQGRVNALSYDVKQQLLVSGSHDGAVHCWSLRANSPKETLTVALLVDRIATYRFFDGFRVTALESLKSKISANCSLNILAGTQNGSIHSLALIRSSGWEEYNLVQKDYVNIGTRNVTGPIINAFCLLYPCNSPDAPPDAFVVGHSLGMGIIELHKRRTDAKHHNLND